MVKQKKRTCITQSGKHYATNCAIQDVRLIWKQKIWFAICEFRWSLTNQNAWFVTSFCTEFTLFCTVKKKAALLLSNQNGEFFSCILLILETVVFPIILTPIGGNKRNNFFWPDWLAEVYFPVEKPENKFWGTHPPFSLKMTNPTATKNNS